MNQQEIRLATADDADAVAAIYEPFVRQTNISFEWQPPTVEEVRQRIRHTVERFPWLVFTDIGRIRGYAYATTYRSRAAYQWGAEVSVYVDPDSQRQGIASHLYGALFSLLRLQGYGVLYGVIALPNPASVSLHERAGFERIGVFPAAGYKLGVWSDVLWMRYELQVLNTNPTPPTPLPALEHLLVASALESALA